ncbi:MAG: response regulator transcription factor [Ferruginibacter sp.]
MNEITVSIVEDIAEVRESIEKLIQQSEDFLLAGSYSNAEQAEQALPDHTPDIVIMDINLPGRNGIDCIKNLKEKCKGSQFIMFTIFEDDQKVFDALEAGACGYLLKKTPKEKILEALKELHEGGSPMSTQIARKVIQVFQKNKSMSEEAAPLTKKEKEILELLAKGYLYKEIAEKTSISANTVKQHIHNIYEKLHVQNRTEAINKVYKR